MAELGPILIVEDIPYLLELMEVTLKYKGYPVITARDGDQALGLIAVERPALILTDILMPKLDGFAFAHKVRNNPKTSDIPIIFVSATYISEQDKAFALSLGAVRFLEKPVEAEE
ncbi:MAG TPA: response regulator, partial [Anaerolineales bacterium]|nr:response regulator [Anaerolineales bacterium]